MAAFHPRRKSRGRLDASNVHRPMAVHLITTHRLQRASIRMRQILKHLQTNNTRALCLKVPAGVELHEGCVNQGSADENDDKVLDHTTPYKEIGVLAHLSSTPPRRLSGSEPSILMETSNHSHACICVAHAASVSSPDTLVCVASAEGVQARLQFALSQQAA